MLDGAAQQVFQGVLDISSALDVVLLEQLLDDGTLAIGESSQKKSYNRIEKIPAKYQMVAEIIRKKANGRGGRRLGAGRPKTVGILDEKKTRSFKLTEYEYMKVKEYISELRKK